MSKLIKIYRFPRNEGFPEEWIFLGSNNTFSSCGFGSLETIENFKCIRPTAKIDLFLGCDFGQLALACQNGHYEEFCVWRADQENQSESTECICPKENFSFFGIGCVCKGK